VTPFYEDIEKGSKNHGKSKSHARQDAVATRAVHTAQVSTSSPDTSRISEAGAICVSDARLQKKFGDFGARSRLLIVRSVAGSGRQIGALLETQDRGLRLKAARRVV